MRKFTFATTLCVMFGLLAVGQAFAVEKWTDEAVEPPKVNNIYQVSTPGQLAWFAKESIGKGISHKIKLVADLNLKGKLWLPIAAGFDKPGFNGQFDGDGHTISNLYIRGEELLEEYTLIKDVKGEKLNCVDQNIGLFGVNGGGSIKNLNLENINIYATNDQSGCGNEISVGGLVGWKTPIASTIENVVVSGKIYTSGKGQGVGGIVGNAHSSSISNSVSKVNITADGDNAFVGGIVGLVKNNEVKITSCVYAGEDLESNGNGGTLGAVVGKVYNGEKTNANLTDVYYDSDIFGDNAVGLVVSPAQTTGNPSPVSDLNNEEVVCKLNKGTLDANGECDKQEPWSVGGQNISWNGSDGFKVTFVADGGTFPENSKTYKMLSNGNTITTDEIASPTKVGAAFAGWSLTKGASEPSDLGIVSKPTRVYAVWKPVFTITFNANGGNFPDGKLTKEKSVAQGDVITVEGIGALPESYCLAYSGDDCDDAMYFTGWSFGQTLSSETPIVDLNELNVFASQNTTLYAIWTEVITYTVTFNAGGHGKTKVNFVRVGEGETITQPVDPTADEGYTFGGWFTEDGLEFKFKTTSITESIILYAHWEPKDYTITYMLGDDCTNNPDNRSTYNVETPTFEFAAPTREGYTFVKWYYDENFSSPATQITQGTTGAKTLYAKWIPNVYTITYRAGSVGHGTVLPSEKEHGKAINLKLVNEGFERPGYTQTGWTTTDGGEKEYESGASYTGNHDLTLFPTWSNPIEYTITYVCEGCVNDPDNRDSYTIETPTFSVKFKNLTRPDGYEMVGWYTATDYKTKVEQIYQGSFGNITLYAKLNKIYNITYVGTDKPNSAKTYTVDKAITLGKPTRAGYTFGGWYDNAKFEGEAVTKIEKGTEGDKTFYAKWIIQKGAITIVDNLDGTNSAILNGTYGGGDDPIPEEADAVEISSDITVNSVTLDRTFNAGKIATLYVPFEIDAENVVGTEVYKFKTVVWNENDRRWKFKVSTATKVMPNTPYVIIPEGTQVTFDIPTSVTLNTTTEGEATAANSWEFVGAYQYEKFTLDNNKPVYLFADQARDGAKLGEFVKIADGAHINPLRAYLVYHKSAAAGMQKSASGNLGGNILLPDELDIEVENENGIVVQTGTLNTVTGEVRMDRWYDLKGRKLNSKPTVKGTYYKNGKRVIVK